jgi:hypothetical protein
MVGHRFLTEDREVQETHWANGKGVVVNFGRVDHELPDGAAAPARGYVPFEETPAGRAYGEPAPPPMNFDYRVPEFGEVTEDFETGYSRFFQLPTQFGPYLPLQESGVSDDAEAVVEGAYSAVARNANPRNAWSNEFIFSNPYTLPLRPDRRYEASFDYKALACEEGNRMYCVVRALGAEPAFVHGAVWYPEPGDTGRLELAFTAPEEGVARLVWGMQVEAALAIDNITVRDRGVDGE